MPYTSNITSSYVDLRTIYLGKALSDGILNPGRKSVLIDGDNEFTAEGMLNIQGGLSGMARLYKRLGLTVGDTLEYSVTPDGDVLIAAPTSPPSVNNTPTDQIIGVFASKKMKHIHLEPFRPDNLDNWEPETETDVYLAFGVLQEFTDYQYCCGVSSSLLQRLGADYSDAAKPDAILIDRRDDRYLMAEWKKRSSDFKSNHVSTDVDVLVCWNNDETDLTQLPPVVLALHSVAEKAVREKLLDN